MAYTALEKMKRINREKFGVEISPMQPELFRNGNGNDLKSAALRFLHDRCEELRFSKEIEAREEADGIFRGTSLSRNQIPYNMQMDIDRLCLERSLEAFIDSGTAEDAYLVYYCYLEMFFGRYGRSKKMVELLSEYEANGSSLLLKHRDHYSHSVYVFALGLAIYETNDHYRKAFQRFYHFDDAENNALQARNAANTFLEYWGLTALFHDIGYPFELPFEQVLSYFELHRKERGKGTLYLSFRGLEDVTKFEDEAKEHFEELFGRRFDDICELLAFDISAKLGKAYDFTEETMKEVIRSKPVSPERFGYYMDHAFFSAWRLYREMEKTLGAEKLDNRHIDALSAILLHNSLFKFSISFYKSKEKHKPPLRMDLHPLAYLLMICDELQCWDRVAYGRNSRTQLHPMAAEFNFSDNAISAVYYYDAEEQDKIREFKRRYRAWEEAGEQGDPPRLKDYSDMAEKEQRFTGDIRKIVDTSDIPLTVIPSTRSVNREKKHTYLSNSSFLHLFDFAVALHGRNATNSTMEQLEERFSSLSLEYQLSTLNRARSFARYLDAINCFYTDKPVDYEMVTRFTYEDAVTFAPLEHERWVREHQAMGWRYGTEYEYLPLPEGILPEDEKKYRRALREQMRCHKLAMDGTLTPEQIREHYMSLPEEDQDKDWKPFNSLLELLRQFDGLRIYRL